MDLGSTLTCGSLSNREALFASGAVKSLDSGVSEARTEFFFKIFLFIYGFAGSSLLCTVFLSLTVNAHNSFSEWGCNGATVNGGCSSSRCGGFTSRCRGFTLWWLQ